MIKMNLSDNICLMEIDTHKYFIFKYINKKYRTYNIMNYVLKSFLLLSRTLSKMYSIIICHQFQQQICNILYIAKNLYVFFIEINSHDTYRINR